MRSGPRALPRDVARRRVRRVTREVARQPATSLPRATLSPPWSTEFLELVILGVFASLNNSRDIYCRA